MRTANSRVRKWRRIASAFLFAQVSAALFAAPSIWARYGSRDVGSTGARVAAFRVYAEEAELLSDDAVCEDPSDPAVYRVRLKNDSECSVSFEVSALQSAGLPARVELQGSSGTLEAGEEKALEVRITVPEESFLELTESISIDDIALEAVFTQEVPGGAS